MLVLDIDADSDVLQVVEGLVGREGDGGSGRCARGLEAALDGFAKDGDIHLDAGDVHAGAAVFDEEADSGVPRHSGGPIGRLKVADDGGFLVG